MKITSEEELAQHDRAIWRGVLEGGVASAILTLGGSYYLQRTFVAYRNLPSSLKALGVVIVVAPAITIQAERRSLQFDRDSRWEGDALHLIDEKMEAEKLRWQQMTSKEKLGEWAARHQYGIIFGGWASSLALAGAIISRDKIQTTAQKVVQARMWAQGLTIGLLIVAGALTHSQRAEAMKHINTDHSWKDLLDQQEREKQEAMRLLKHEATPPTRRTDIPI